MRRNFDLHRIALSAFVMGLAILLAPAVFAQASEGSLMIPAEIEVRGRGWAQIVNFREMLDFALSLTEVTLLTALLAFHPVNIAYRSRTVTDDLRKGMFLFALIGMLTGFLVVHHGYLIGFVIFGIGGLFRFRMESSTIADTGQMVIVSLIGLAVGLDLPVMALIGAVAAWVVLFLFGRGQALGLEVKFDEKGSDPGAVRRLQEHLEGKGFKVVSVAKTKFKPVAHYALSSRMPQAQSALVQEMSEIQARKDSGVSDWHID
ncbi:hypothetical protein Ga0609869_002065 [Rhodovulum iodosum]|uniref:DUF4956 domain-containing protein n=1 Tax=Rhodovulum iodosum TaxID=68291 RepID=A0ABV3XWH2_9RHOB|nr:MgtC/SapB family protein [Rhodovulum robiginosum]RSK32151.1 hypothetical protein EJA01_13090 [Rhodovulum robiginosum]